MIQVMKYYANPKNPGKSPKRNTSLFTWKIVPSHLRFNLKNLKNWKRKQKCIAFKLTGAY